MLDSEETAVKMHYICQTYVMKQKGQQMALHVDKVFEYKSAAEAEERAEREARREGCVGADAYMLSEDPTSGEVSEPTFLARHGAVPEVEGD
jgi:hypothetical protein